MEDPPESSTPSESMAANGPGAPMVTRVLSFGRKSKAAPPSENAPKRTLSFGRKSRHSAADAPSSRTEQPLQPVRRLDGMMSSALWSDDDRAFLSACMWGDLSTAKLLVTTERARRADGKGGQPIHWACARGHLDMIQWLHANGAALDVETVDGRTPLDYARQCNHGKVVAWLGAPTTDADLGI